MPGFVAGVFTALHLASSMLLTVGPSTLTDAAGTVRGVVAFLLVFLIGGLLIWRFEGFVGRSIEASTAKPVRSIGYGLAAHAVVAFASVYLASQLAQSGIVGGAGGSIATGVGLLGLGLAGALGFTVVGSILSSLAGGSDRRFGLAVGAVIAAVVGSLDVATGGLIWFVLVSMGIGGPTRRWLQADALDDLS